MGTGLRRVPTEWRQFDYQYRLKQVAYWLGNWAGLLTKQERRYLTETLEANRSKLKDGFEPLHEDLHALGMLVGRHLKRLQARAEAKGVNKERVLLPNYGMLDEVPTREANERKWAREVIHLGTWDLPRVKNPHTPEGG